MGAPRHGVDGLIYVGGNEVTGGNQWSIQFNPDLVEVLSFGDSWKTQLRGAAGWSGNISAYDVGDANVLADAAVLTTASAVLIYPDRATLTTYYSGSAFFGASGDGWTTGAVGLNGDFTGTGALTLAGWT